MGVFTDAARNLIAPRRVQAQAPANPTPTQLSYPQSNYDPNMNARTTAVQRGYDLTGVRIRVTKIKNGYLVGTAEYEGDTLEHYYAEDLKAVGEYVTAYCVEQELTK